MLIASKYEEMYAPEVRDFVYITDNAYSSAEILAMEQKMLQQLDFSLGTPLCVHFLRRDSRAGDVSCVHRHVYSLHIITWKLAKLCGEESLHCVLQCTSKHMC